MQLFGKKKGDSLMRVDFNASTAVELLLWAANEFQENPLRRNQMVHFPGKGDLIVAGDLHNHTRNFEKIIRRAALDQFPDRHLILQEVIHGGPLGPQGQDTSFDMLLSALMYAQKFPGRVHMLLANHDLAQVQKMAILKDGYDLTERFERHFVHKYGSEAANVMSAYKNFVYCMPLAAITVNGIFLSHSLPSDRDLAQFDATIMRRPLVPEDYERAGSVFKLIWGRNQTAAGLNVLSKTWWSDFFICGHQQQDEGHKVIVPNLLIVDSSHNLGSYLHIDLARQYLISTLAESARPIAEIA